MDGGRVGKPSGSENTALTPAAAAAAAAPFAPPPPAAGTFADAAAPEADAADACAAAATAAAHSLAARAAVHAIHCGWGSCVTGLGRENSRGGIRPPADAMLPGGANAMGRVLSLRKGGAEAEA